MTCARSTNTTWLSSFGLHGCIVVAAWLSASTVPAVTRADGPVVTLEGTAALPVTEPQSKLFGPGGSLAVGVLYPLAPQFLVGGRVRAAGLLDGDAPEDPGRVDPDIRDRFEAFWECATCGRVYWRGSHWWRMLRLVQSILPREDPPIVEAPS